MPIILRAASSIRCDPDRGRHVLTQSGTTQRDVTYQLRAGGKWAVVELVVVETLLEGHRVRYLHVQPISESVQSLNALSLRRASPSALFAVLLAVLVIACALYAAVQVVRSPLERRWLWVIVALLGFGKFGVEWHTGAITDQWFAVQLFGASLVREGFYGRWWVSVSLPGGAFIALERRRRALAAKACAIALAVSPEPSHDVA
ncbi:MAG TPA: hypothetical protein VNW46_13375 [Gemmatimonadaceae bacterium]|jgi:hypothetical protein|nr:hypothetical protein [Gemmatimonadaceae bacterium]